MLALPPQQPGPANTRGEESAAGSPSYEGPSPPTNLLGLLRGDLTGSPRDVVQVDEGVDDEEQVHRRDGQQVEQAGDNTLELLRMHAGGDEEAARESDQENGRRRTDAVLAQLQRRTHNHSHHHEGVSGREDLGDYQLMVHRRVDRRKDGHAGGHTGGTHMPYVV